MLIENKLAAEKLEDVPSGDGICLCLDFRLERLKVASIVNLF